MQHVELGLLYSLFMWYAQMSVSKKFGGFTEFQFNIKIFVLRNYIFPSFNLYFSMSVDKGESLRLLTISRASPAGASNSF